MGSVAKSNRHKDVMLDIDSELAYWRLHYTQGAFHRTPRPFDDYLFTLKFGYDMYLLNHGCDLEKLLPAMRSRYQATATARDHLDWPLAEAVIRETWKRMQPAPAQRLSRGAVRPAAIPRMAGAHDPAYLTG